MKNLARNFFYQSLFQITKIIIPIITIPIVSNALGPSGIGIYNYTFSIAQYFVLVAGLGVAIYGNREITLTLNRNKEELSKVFWEILMFKAMTTIFVLMFYFALTFFLENKIYLLIQSLTIIAVFFDVSWFFMGIEDFKKTSISNLLVQIVTFVLIVFLIKNEGDALKYTLIQALGLVCSQISVWLFIPKYIHFVKVSIGNSFNHLKGSFEYFIPQIAIMLYTNLNKTLLGFTMGSMAVGYFTNSLQLNTVFITIITTLDLVLLPHMTGFFAKENVTRIVRMMEKTIHLQLYFSIPIMFGMLTVYDKLVPWFFGEKFIYINNVIPYFSALIIIIPLGMSISRQYLMPIGHVKEYNKSVIVGAIINIVANLILLPTIGFFGVVFSNILAECFVTFVRTRSFLKSTDFKFEYRKIGIFLLGGILMCIVTRSLTSNLSSSILTNLIQFAIALPIYLTITTLFKANPFLDLLRKK
ncbi:oligosaccharide flippase family protein [Enterococcus lactis]|uniref:oligosaccharide flippase family protein n=1 Tax=Enterococcus lactis TaxID=357441 RepID=UPI001BD054F8|nr:oligosaccharide flippase family protein [Enterococcus lactis]